MKVNFWEFPKLMVTYLVHKYCSTLSGLGFGNKFDYKILFYRSNFYLDVIHFIHNFQLS